MFIPIDRRLFVALDVSSIEEAVENVQKLKGTVYTFKCGMQLCNAVGTPKVLEVMSILGVDVFIDEKFDDIPTTVRKAVEEVARRGAAFINIMAVGGVDMMIAAGEGKGNAKILAVTVLTSREENEAHLSIGAPVKAKILQYAREGKLARVDGYILAPQDLEFLTSREELFFYYEPEFITPAIRPKGSDANDQVRHDTAYRAMFLGATRIVCGRPVLNAKDPLAVVKQLHEEIFEGLRDRWLMSLFSKGHVKFGAFTLKLHEKNPEAPLSPVYMNMRKMSQPIVDRMAELMYEQALKNNLVYDYLLPIPNAGDPIAEALSKLCGKPVLKLVKQEATATEGRKITSKIIGEFEPGKIALPVDDLITGADTKLEAITAAEDNGLIVNDLLLGMDRQQGGVEILEKLGKRVIVVSKLKESLDLFVREGKIDEKKKAEIIEYLENNRVSA